MRIFLNVLLIWVLAWVALFFARNLLRLFQKQIAARMAKPSDYRRIDTLIGVIQHAVTVILVGVAILLTLSEFGISITPMLATAGVAGIAIGFGAQSLVRDFFSGFFLLIENQVSEGEMIEAAGKSGCVEEITLRHIRIRDEDGSLHFIPNGIITTVTNKSRTFAVAVIDITVPRQQDPDQAAALLSEVGSTLQRDPEIGPWILGVVEVAGIEKLEDAAVTLRCKLKVLPLKQSQVRREFLRRARLALDKPAASGAGMAQEPSTGQEDGGAHSDSPAQPSAAQQVPIRRLPDADSP